MAAPLPLDLDLVTALAVDDEAVHRRVAALAVPPAGAERRAAVVELVGLLDLTSLAGDETPAALRALCARALHPLGEARGEAAPRVAAVCVLDAAVPVVADALAGSAVAVACATGDFPACAAPLRDRLAEIRAAAARADEIDAVVDRAPIDRGDWRAVYAEVRSLRDACGRARLKAILRTGEMDDLATVARASRVALLAGADFIKTSTGRERVNATLPAGLVMAEQLRDHHARTGARAGLKPAGGVRTADDALRWRALVTGVLGPAWLAPSRFRIGASALLDALAREA